MPQGNVDVEVEPRLDPGNGCLQDRDGPGGAGETPRKRVGDPSAGVVADHVGLTQAESVDELADVLGQVGGGVADGARCRAAHAAQVDRDDREPLRQPRHDPPPLVPVLRETVQEYQGRAVPAADVVDRGAVDAGRPGGESGTEFRHR